MSSAAFAFPTDYDPRPHAAAICAPVAAILLCDADWERAHAAVGAFEAELFPPDTPANHLYQVVHDRSWGGIILAVAVFPGEHLPRLQAVVGEHGLFLLDGSPKAVICGQTSAYDAKARVKHILGVDVGEVRTVHGSPHFFQPTNVSAR